MARRITPGAGTATNDAKERTMNQRDLKTVVWMLALAAPLASLAQTTPSGRLLASNCFQCHGTNGRGPGFDRLTGESASEIYKELKEFQSGKEGNGIMARHAMGYTDAQLRALSDWLSRQR
jgi:cytochrome c553